MNDSTDKNADPTIQVPSGNRVFRWFVSLLDMAFGLGLLVLGIYILFDRRGPDFYTSIPDEFFGALLSGYGSWALYSGYRLITESDLLLWQAGRRRHFISAALTCILIAWMWLAALTDTSDGLGAGVGTVIYTFVFGVVAGFQFLVFLGMSKLAPKQPLWNLRGLFDRLADELKPPDQQK